jgi:hypothetical protein
MTYVSMTTDLPKVLFHLVRHLVRALLKCKTVASPVHQPTPFVMYFCDTHFEHTLFCGNVSNICGAHVYVLTFQPVGGLHLLSLNL